MFSEIHFSHMFQITDCFISLSGSEALSLSCRLVTEHNINLTVDIMPDQLKFICEIYENAFTIVPSLNYVKQQTTISHLLFMNITSV